MKKLFVIIASLFLLNSTFASSDTKTVTISYLQNSQFATLKPTNVKTGTYTLTLSHVSPFTTYFSDRPNRIVGLISMPIFLKKWQHGENSFSSDAPNAVLSGIIRSNEKIRDLNLVMELTNPTYNKANAVLSYTVHLLKDKQTPALGTIKLNYVTLFIDDNVCLSCIG